MNKAPTPENEPNRLKALLRYNVLDTDEEAIFDDLTRLAAAICNTPIALVSLVDSERQWFKSHYGLEARETPRDISFCGHAINQEQVFMVKDAFEDSRFADNPLVTGQPIVRFYAGAPLLDPQGYKIGTLCVIDHKPRELGDEQLELLKNLSRHVILILENRKKRLELERERARFEFAISGSNDGIWDWDIKLNTVYYSPKFLEFLDYKKSVPNDFGFFEARIHPLDKDRVLKQIQLHLEQNTPYETEYRLKTENRDYRWFMAKGQAMRDDAGKPIRMAGSLCDVTERKFRDADFTAQIAAIEKSQAVVEFDMEGHILKANELFLNMMGYQLNEIKGKHHKIFLTEAYSQSKEYKNFWTSLKNGIPQTAEFMRMGKNREVWIQGSYTPILDLEGIPFKVVKYATDITDKKRAEDRFRLVVESAPNSIVMIDSERIIKMVNVQTESLFGYDRSELIGKKLEVLIPEHYGHNHPEHVKGYLQKAETRSMGVGRDLFGLKKNGKEIPIEIGLNPLKTDEGQFVLASIIDITERKKIELLKNEFVSTVSHELRTPLTSIRGSLGLITGGVTGDLPEKAKSLLQIAMNNCDRLVRLINDILDIEKIESGKMDFELNEFNLIDVVIKTITSNEAYATQYNVTLLLQCQLTSEQVLIDEDRITQVLTNLISNAVKFSPKGGEVIISITKDDTSIRVSITDHGNGIPEEFRSKIFGRFAQADSSDTKQKGGTGLGLSICKIIIENHHGTIGFESELGKGSIFYFELPLVLDKTVAKTDESQLNKSVSSAPRFLVCEDDSDIATILRLLLEQEGFFVDVATDAKSAKQKLWENNYKGMTLDIMLPDQDGFSLLAELRKNETTKNLPVIVVSAKELSSNSRQEKITHLNISDWISKPIRVEQLKHSALQILESKCGSDSRVLYVEDDNDLARIVCEILDKTSQIDIARSCKEAREKISVQSYDLILLDLGLPDGSGLSLLPLINEKCTKTKVVIFSAINMSIHYPDNVAAVLLKSKTSNEQLKETVQKLLGLKS